MLLRQQTAEERRPLSRCSSLGPHPKPLPGFRRTEGRGSSCWGFSTRKPPADLGSLVVAMTATTDQCGQLPGKQLVVLPKPLHTVKRPLPPKSQLLNARVIVLDRRRRRNTSRRRKSFISGGMGRRHNPCSRVDIAKGCPVLTHPSLEPCGGSFAEPHLNHEEHYLCVCV